MAAALYVMDVQDTSIGVMIDGLNIGYAEDDRICIFTVATSNTFSPGSIVQTVTIDPVLSHAPQLFCEIDGLSPQTSYFLRAEITVESITLEESFQTIISGGPHSAYRHIRIKKVSGNAISACITGLDTSYAGDDRYVQWFNVNSAGEDESLFDGLIDPYEPKHENDIPITAGKSYNLRAEIHYNGGVVYLHYPRTIQTPSIVYPIIERLTFSRTGPDGIYIQFELKKMVSDNTVRIYVGGDSDWLYEKVNTEDGHLYQTGRVSFDRFLYDNTIRIRAINHFDFSNDCVTEKNIRCCFVPFSWDVPKVQNETIVVTAAEWNAFCDAINAWREYKNRSIVPFTRVNPGGLGQEGAVITSSMIDAQEAAHPNSVITVVIVNRAIRAINEMLPEGEPNIPTQTSGNVITAALFNEMVTKLNGLS